MERGTYPYSQKTLEAAAKAYGCKPEDILLVNPLLEGEPIDVDELGDLAELFKGATPEQRAELIGYARGLIRRH